MLVCGHCTLNATRSRHCRQSLNPGKKCRRPHFQRERWIFNKPASPFKTEREEKWVERLKSISIFLDHCPCLSLLYLHYLPLVQFILSLNCQGPINVERRKENSSFLLMCTHNREKFDVASRRGEKIHTPQGAYLFCLQQPRWTRSCFCSPRLP